MQIQTVRTQAVTSGSITMSSLLDLALQTVTERSVVVVTSKVVSLCEGRTIPLEQIDKEQLIYQEADLYALPDPAAEHRYHYTIVNETLIPAAGIDESNGNGNYILWPADPFASANSIRKHVRERFNLKDVGVVITDSTIFPSRWGTLGIAIAHSGFAPIKDYIGNPDIFGRILKMSKSNIAGGLAAAAVLVMGEAAEQTPIALVTDVPFVDFHEYDSTPEERQAYYISPLNDEPFAPFFNAVSWQRGHKS